MMISRLRNVKSDQPVQRKKSDSSTFLLLENHWKQATDVMENNMENASEGVLTVISHMGQIITLLKLANAEEHEQSACKVFWVENKCSQKFIDWLNNVQNTGIKLDYTDQKKLVSMLYTLCELAATKDYEILGSRITSGDNYVQNSWEGTCSLASLLLEFSLSRDTSIAEPARVSFLLLIQLASRFPELEKNLSGHGISNIIISGLSASFAQLPTLTKGNAEQLRPFISFVEFVDKIAKNSPETLSKDIADVFYEAFLSHVIQPSLTQSLHEYEEVVFNEIETVTFYLQIICETISHPFLIRSLINFINTHLLSIFVQRTNHAQLSVTVSTLSLLNVLLDLYCEDLWFELILRHLLPQHHLMVSERNQRLSDIDFNDASSRFFALIPPSIGESMGQEFLSGEYVQYLNNESERWSNLSSIINNTPSNSTSKGDTENLVKNCLFPRWELAYDGVDSIAKLHEKSEDNQTGLANGTATSDFGSEDDKSTKRDPLEGANPNGGEEGSEPEASTPTFITINLLPGVEETSLTSSSGGINNLSIDSQRNGESSGRGSISNNLSLAEPSNMGASYGLFLDSLFNHLSNWATLHPDVILMVTQIISTLASSRIPLISSLILNPSIIVQPSFQSFNSILLKVKGELEGQIKNVPKNFIYDVWTSMNKDANVPKKSTSLMSSSVSFDSTISMLFPGGNESLDSFKKTMSGAFSSMFGKKKVIPNSPSFPSNPQQAGDSSPAHEGLQSIGNKGYRYVSPTQGPIQNDTNRLMTMKAIYFTHFLFELSAIGQTNCWKLTN